MSTELYLLLWLQVPPNEKKKTGTELFQVLAPLNNNLKIEDRVLLPVARAKSTKEGATLNKEIQVFGVGSQKYVPKHMAKNRYKPQIDGNIFYKKFFIAKLLEF